MRSRHRPIRVFVSYAREDETHLRALRQHLGGPTRDGTLKLWFDEKVPPGYRWRQEILGNLNRAEVVLFLVSPAYLDSEFCMLEANLATERMQSGKLRVLPILVRHVDWSSAPFADLQFLLGVKPVPESGAGRDEAFALISQKLREVAAEIRRDRLEEPGDASGATGGLSLETLKKLVFLLADQGELGDNFTLLNLALEACRRESGEESDEFAALLSCRGLALRDLGELEEAQIDLKNALAVLERLHGRSDPLVASLLVDLGGLLVALREEMEALALLEEAVATLEQNQGAEAGLLARARIHLAEALGALGSRQEAEEILKRVLAVGPVDRRANAAACSALGRLYSGEGRLRTARAHFKKAVQFGVEAHGGDHPLVAIDLHNLGLVLQSLGDRRQAEEHFRKALQIFTTKLGDDSPRAAWTQAELESLTA